MTRAVTTDDILQALRRGALPTLTKAEAVAFAKRVERLRAFEQAIRGAAAQGRDVFVGAVIERFDATYRDPNDSTPATTKEGL